MKTKIITFATAFALALSMTACSEPATDNSAEIESLKAANESLQAENEDLKWEIENLQITIDGLVDEEPTENVESEETIESNKDASYVLGTPVKVGDTMEITLTSIEWTDRVNPSNTEGVYSYYESEDGELYFVVRGTVTSFAPAEFDLQYSTEATMVVNKQYITYATTCLEEADGTSFYGRIKSLQTLNFVVIGSFSEGVHDICENIYFEFNIPNNIEDLGYYDENCDHTTIRAMFENPDKAE